ncbi:hypothetical protein SZN_05282 [Streptomyces zinciresistens K42]|uniref:Uncharacterized protein n=1 Tax=Streptomyces zinciresistens K42 TaxID=700597 RepID=G2G6E9_9ACTN|nr:hypothetical protein SZN_05282 [Streptomyces zinciresistens K42]
MGPREWADHTTALGSTENAQALLIPGIANEPDS